MQAASCRAIALHDQQLKADCMLNAWGQARPLQCPVAETSNTHLATAMDEGPAKSHRCLARAAAWSWIEVVKEKKLLETAAQKASAAGGPVKANN